MKFTKTRKLITERLTFINQCLEALPKDEISNQEKIDWISETKPHQRLDFIAAKGNFKALEKALNGDRSSFSYIDKTNNIDNTIKYLSSCAIKPFLSFQKQSRQKLLDDMERQEKIQEQPYEEHIKMTEGQYIDFVNNYQNILDIYNNDIREIEGCLSEINRALAKKEK